MQGGGSGRKYAPNRSSIGHPSLACRETRPPPLRPHATHEWTATCKDLYDNEYAIGFTHEIRDAPAGRPARLTPAHERLKRAGAVFTATYGWERPSWFTAGRIGRAPQFPPLQRPFGHRLRGESRAASAPAFSTFRASPSSKRRGQVRGYLNGIGVNRMPGRVGGIVLTHALTRVGGVLSEFSVTRLGPEHFYLVSAAAAEAHDHDILRARLPPDNSVRFENGHDTLRLSGPRRPRARDILGRLTRANFPNAAFPWLSGARSKSVPRESVRSASITWASSAGSFMRPSRRCAPLRPATRRGGSRSASSPFGLRAIDSLRLEKMYRGWRTDLTTEYRS